MTPNFISGVVTSYRSGNWTKFIEQFGTSYVNDVMMGARATQEIVYESNSVSEMTSTGTSIDVAGKAQFRRTYLAGDYNSTANQ